MSDLEGHTIEEVRPMTEDELAELHWENHRSHSPPPVMVLDDGRKVFPSMDTELNGPGQLLFNEDDQTYMVAFEEKTEE